MCVFVYFSGVRVVHSGCICSTGSCSKKYPSDVKEICEQNCDHSTYLTGVNAVVGFCARFIFTCRLVNMFVGVCVSCVFVCVIVCSCLTTDSYIRV